MSRLCVLVTSATAPPAVPREVRARLSSLALAAFESSRPARSPRARAPARPPPRALQIRFFLLQNRQGKTRLSKWYVAIEESDKRKIESEVHRLVTSRDSKFTNFVEFRTYKIIYRRYAGLFFAFCVDTNDNELAYLEAIHLFVEMLDRYFGNVCELDLVFNFHKVYAILDEYIVNGEMQETSQLVMLDRLKELEKMLMT